MSLAYLDGSGRKGGKLLLHLSHQKGRDVDVTYIGRNERGRVYPSRPSLFKVGYVMNYGKDGRCGGLVFDRGANLSLILALMQQEHCDVARIFVEPYIERWLVEEARRQGIAPSVVHHMKENVLGYAGKNAAKHDDHMHVRFQ